MYILLSIFNCEHYATTIHFCNFVVVTCRAHPFSILPVRLICHSLSNYNVSTPAVLITGLCTALCYFICMVNFILRRVSLIIN